MKASLTLFLSITGLLASSYAFTASGKVYKWTDEKGLIHYSERPPLGTQTEIVKPEIGRSEPVNYGAPSDEKAEKAKEGTKLEKKVDDEKSALKDPARCDSARKNLNVLKTYARIKLKGDDGEYRFLTPDEQKQKADEATKIIEESCE
jgi:hypothetical protein